MSSIIDPRGLTIKAMETIGDRVREARQDKGLTQQTLADKCGTTKQAISQIETGKTLEPAATLIEKISQVLSVNTSWTITGRGSRARASQSMNLDLDTLRATFNLIGGILAEDDRNVDLNRHAESFAYVYQEGGELDPQQLQHIREVLRSAYQGEQNGRRDVAEAGGVPDSATGRAAKHR